jgi:hypothetical protein
MSQKPLDRYVEAVGHFHTQLLVELNAAHQSAQIASLNRLALLWEDVQEASHFLVPAKPVCPAHPQIHVPYRCLQCGLAVPAWVEKGADSNERT